MTLLTLLFGDWPEPWRFDPMTLFAAVKGKV